MDEFILETEACELNKLLEKIYGYHLVLIADPKLGGLVSDSLITHHVIIHPKAVQNGPKISAITAQMESLPIASDSVDLVVLLHTLEETSNPHELLREAYRILIPEGQIIVTGFNPLSWWGARHRYKGGKLLSVTRLKDWLQLLNFQITQSKMFHYRPPLGNTKFQQQMLCLEKIGARFWPFLGGAYAIQAVKRVIPLTPIRAKWRTEKIWQPAAEGITSSTLKSENQESS